MNEFSGPVKLLAWVAGAVLALGLVRSLGPLTFKMAEAALDAQEHQMSYGKYSRALWSTGRKAPSSKPTR